MRRTHRLAAPLAALAIIIPAAPLAATASTGESPAAVSATPQQRPDPSRNEIVATPAPPTAEEADDHVQERGRAVIEVDGEPTLVERVVTALRIPSHRRKIRRFRVPGRVGRVGLDRGFAVTGKVPTVKAVKRVKRRNRRMVKVQQQIDGRWRTIAKKRAWAGGGFRMRVQSPQVPTLATVRAVAPNVKRVRGLPKRKARRQARLLPRAVSRQRHVGFGSAAQVHALRIQNTQADWTYLFADHPEPQRWQQCRITWAHEGPGPYAGAAAHVEQAFQRVQEGTPFTFEEVPHTADNDHGAQIRLVWRSEREDAHLAGSVVGYAATSATAEEIVDVEVVLDEGTVGLRQGFHGSDGRTWGTVFTHEITHGMGLGHAFGDEQVMHSFATELNGLWGAGDLAGLRAISSACRS